MFELTAAWWELLLRASIVYCALLVLVRVAGRRTVGRFTNFDLLVVMLLGSAVSSALNAGDHSITAGLLIAATMIALSITIAFLSSRVPAFRHGVEGHPVLIGRAGDIFEKELKRLRVPVEDVYQALRQSDCEQAQMRYALLEADGEISLLKDSRIPAGGADVRSMA